MFFELELKLDRFLGLGMLLIYFILYVIMLTCSSLFWKF